MSEKSVFREAWSPEMTSKLFPVSCFWARGFVPHRKWNLTLLVHQNMGKEKRYRVFFYAILISTLRRFNREHNNKKICHQHFKGEAVTHMEKINRFQIWKMIFSSVRTLIKFAFITLRTCSLVQFWDNNQRIAVYCSLNFSVHICNLCKKSGQRIRVVIVRSRNLHTNGEANQRLYEASILHHLT